MQFLHALSADARALTNIVRDSCDKCCLLSEKKMELVRVFPMEQVEMSSACDQRVLVIKNEIIAQLMIKPSKYGC